jgi:hypothetical protein
LATADFPAEAEERYQDAVARRDAILAAWEAEGSPLLTTGSAGQLVVHPYVTMLRDHDLLIDKLAARARPGRPGRLPTAVPGLPPPIAKRRVRRVK